MMKFIETDDAWTAEDCPHPDVYLDWDEAVWSCSLCGDYERIEKHPALIPYAAHPMIATCIVPAGRTAPG